MCIKRKRLFLAFGVICLCLFFSSLLGAAENNQAPDVKKLALVSAAEPLPALKYRLLPGLLDQVNGNAVLFYQAAVALCPDGGKDDLGAKIVQWLKSPLDELPRNEVDRALSTFRLSFHQIKLATARNQCDWQLPIDEVYAMNVPGLSTFRNIARALALRARLEIADGNIDQALPSIRQGLTLGQGVSQGPTLVQDLVGLAISTLMLGQVESLMESADAPNLYWALTALPTPFIDMRRAMEFERGGLFLEFPALRHLYDEIMTPAQASAFVNDLLSRMQSLATNTSKPVAKPLPLRWVMTHYTDAKEYLASKGFSADRLETMPAAQVVVLFQVQEYLALQDNASKWFFVPFHLAQPRFKEADRRMVERGDSRGVKGNLFTAILSPALTRIAFLRARFERQICLLRTIEGLRLYAANHDDTLPRSLAEIDTVPIPLDPVTGKAFLYQLLDDGSARLEAPESSFEKRSRPVYELTVKP